MSKPIDSRSRYAPPPPSIGEWMVSQRLEVLVAQRTRELERTIERLQTRQAELEALANHDYLTGLASRRLLKDRFLCAVERAKRSGSTFALLVIDLDGFKRINDTHGHAAGDLVLVEVAQRLTASLRTSDTAARVGGDEFVLIVECLSAPLATDLICKKLKNAVSETIQLPSGGVVTIGASVGQALYADNGMDLDKMLVAADQSMYACKAVALKAMNAHSSPGAKAPQTTMH